MHLSKYLYSKDCNGQKNVFVDLDKEPILEWKKSLPTNPAYGIETMAVWDKKGNLFLGCHNGTLYSLDSKGSVRFSYQTGYKIFSTPLILDENVFFCSGDGYIYNLTTSGKLNWKTKISDAKFVNKKKSFSQKLLSKFFNLRIPKKSIGTIRTWASLNIDSLNRLYVNTAKEGLIILNLEGIVLKKIAMQYNYPLAGVSFFKDDTFIVPDQKRFLYKYTTDFKLLWKLDIGNYTIWSNPITDKQTNNIYIAATKENKSKVCCFNNRGELIWVKRFCSELRGGISLSTKSGLIVPLFNGNLVSIDKISGVENFNVNMHLGDRVLWTTATSDLNGNIFIAVRTSRFKGKIIFVTPEGKISYSINTGKTLSPPAIDDQLNIYFGDWEGYYYKYKLYTNEREF